MGTVIPTRDQRSGVQIGALRIRSLASLEPSAHIEGVHAGPRKTMHICIREGDIRQINPADAGSLVSSDGVDMKTDGRCLYQPHDFTVRIS